MDLQISCATRRGAARVRLAGALTVHTAERFLDAIAEAVDEAREIVVDLRTVDLIDHEGVAALLTAHDRAAGRGRLAARRDRIRPRLRTTAARRHLSSAPGGKAINMIRFTCQLTGHTRRYLPSRHPAGSA